MTSYYERNKERVKARTAAYAKAHPEQARARQKRWRDANPGHWRHKHWKRAGMNVAEAQAAFDAHDGRCALCGTDKPGGLRGWHVDHDHRTKKVRGIVCCGCNLRLGWLEKVGLPAAEAYLKRGC